MKIGLTGSHGVGKTTLLKILSEKLPNYDVQLESLTRKAVSGADKVNLTTPKESEKLISEAYMEYFLENINKNFIASRHMIDVLAYTMYLQKRNNNMGTDIIFAIEEKIYEIIEKKIFDLVIYVPIEFKQVESGIFREGQQENPDYQKDIDTIIKFLLWGYGIKYITISGTVEERINQIMGHINVKN